MVVSYSAGKGSDYFFFISSRTIKSFARTCIKNRKCPYVNRFSPFRHLPLDDKGIRLPEMTTHIDMPIGLEMHTLTFQQRALTTPSRSRAPFLIDHPMTRQQLCTRRIAKGTTYHPRMAGPTSPCSYDTIGSHLSARYLTDNIQHVVTKLPCLLRRHSVGIVFHTRYSMLYFCRRTAQR